jgi:polyphosphate kinase
VVAPVADPGARQRIDEILETELTDPGAWELQRDGSYVQRGGEQAGASGRAQDIFLTRHGCLAVTPVTQAAVT